MEKIWEHFQLGPSTYYSHSPVARHLKMIFLFFWEGKTKLVVWRVCNQHFHKSKLFRKQKFCLHWLFCRNALGSHVLVDHTKLHPAPPTTLGSLVATFPFPQILEMIADSLTRTTRRIRSHQNQAFPNLYIISNELMNFRHLLDATIMFFMIVLIVVCFSRYHHHQLSHTYSILNPLQTCWPQKTTPLHQKNIPITSTSVYIPLQACLT